MMLPFVILIGIWAGIMYFFYELLNVMGWTFGNCVFFIGLAVALTIHAFVFIPLSIMDGGGGDSQGGWQ